MNTRTVAFFYLVFTIYSFSSCQTIPQKDPFLINFRSDNPYWRMDEGIITPSSYILDTIFGSNDSIQIQTISHSNITKIRTHSRKPIVVDRTESMIYLNDIGATDLDFENHLYKNDYKEGAVSNIFSKDITHRIIECIKILPIGEKIKNKEYTIQNAVYEKDDSPLILKFNIAYYSDSSYTQKSVYEVNLYAQEITKASGKKTYNKAKDFYLQNKDLEFYATIKTGNDKLALNLKGTGRVMKKSIGWVLTIITAPIVIPYFILDGLSHSGDGAVPFDYPFLQK